MRIHSILLFIFLFLSFLGASQEKKKVDLIVLNAQIYTVNERFEVMEAMAIQGGKIKQVGSNKAILDAYDSKNRLDAQGKTIYPGLIDAHAHFFGYGKSLLQVDLVGSESWEEVVGRVKRFASNHLEGWLIGRGWNQNAWADQHFPNKRILDSLFPSRPVFLERIDGHAAVVNQAVLDLSGIKPNQQSVGGEIETQEGVLTGILVDNAVQLASKNIPDVKEDYLKKGLLEAQNNCFAVGLTTVVDCGLDYKTLEFLEKMQSSGELKMRMNVMLSDDSLNYEYLTRRGVVHTDRMTVRSFKLYADGALGSRGACLLEPYSDRVGHYGFLLKNKAYYERMIGKMVDKGFQLCTHAIGDSANRVILQLYGAALKGKNDLRWRIEHAQVVNEADFDLFAKFSIIPSVQPTHATSDMYWAKDRLGDERVKGAYSYKRLLRQNGWIPLGTDFPVEQINPILTFYAAVVRKDAKGFPATGFQTENALTREEALKGMTIWAAKGHFEEREKGSLEIGKAADFIIVNQDMMKVEEGKILETKVLGTYLRGEKVF